MYSDHSEWDSGVQEKRYKLKDSISRQRRVIHIDIVQSEIIRTNLALLQPFNSRELAEKISD
jgi:hypothetical protein